MTMRPCNALESFFVSNNIRFAVGVSFPPRNKDEVEGAVRDTFRFADIRVVVEDQSPHLRIGDGLVPITLEPMNASNISEALRRHINQDVPASGPLRCTLLLKRPTDNEDTANPFVDGLIWNLNHASMDGIATRILVERFFTHLSSLDTSRLSPPPRLLSIDWIDPVRRSLTELEQRHEEVGRGPAFFPLPSNPLILSDIMGFSVESSRKAGVDDEAMIHLDGDTCARCLDKARANSTTLTGLWMACLVRATAEAFFQQRRGEYCSVILSILVDLRRFLAEDAQSISQVQATVTVGETVSRTAIETSESQSSLPQHIWNMARSLRRDMRNRIERGEAHRQAIATAEGRFDELPTSTIELANQGIYGTPPGCSVCLSQRFDEYEGLSVLVYSERASGTCIGTAGAGDDLDHDKVNRFFTRVRELLAAASTA